MFPFCVSFYRWSKLLKRDCLLNRLRQYDSCRGSCRRMSKQTIHIKGGRVLLHIVPSSKTPSVFVEIIQFLQGFQYLIGGRTDGYSIQHTVQTVQPIRLIGVGEFLAAIRAAFSETAFPGFGEKTARRMLFDPFSEVGPLQTQSTPADPLRKVPSPCGATKCFCLWRFGR